MDLFHDKCCKCGRPVHWSEIREDDRGNVYCPECAPEDATWTREGPSEVFRIDKEQLKTFCDVCKKEVTLEIIDVYEEREDEIIFATRCPECKYMRLITAKKVRK